mgnify:CR=1 FL=1
MAVEVLGSGGDDGTTVSSSASEKAGMHGVAAVQNAFLTAVSTTASTTTSPAGYATTTQANAIATAVIAMRQALIDHGILAAS